MVGKVKFKQYAESTGLVVNILSGVATVAAAIVGIYAFLGTNIAEELTKQFNTQVAALNEEKIDLLRTKRDLEAQIAATELDKTKSYEEAERLKASVEALEQDKSRQIAELQELRDERQKLTAENEALADSLSQQRGALEVVQSDLAKSANENHHAFVELAVNNLEFRAAVAEMSGPVTYRELHNEALAASTIKQYREWQKQNSANVLPENPTQEDYDAYGKRHFDLYDSIPEGWRYLELAKWGVDSAPKGTDIATDLRMQLAVTSRKLSAMEFMKDKLLYDGVEYIKFSKANNARVIQAIEKYLLDKNALLKGDMVIVIPVTASDDEVEVAAKRVLKTVDGVKALLRQMPADIREILFKQR